MVDDYTGHPADSAADRADADVPSGDVPSGDVPAGDAPAGTPAVDQAYDTGSDAWIRAQVTVVTPAVDHLPKVPLPVVPLPVIPLPEEPLRVSLSPRLARRRPTRSPLRAVAGAAIAVAGVAVVIGALLVVQDDPQDSSPTVAAALDSAVAGHPLATASSPSNQTAPRPAGTLAGTPAAAPGRAPAPAIVASPQVSSPLLVLNNSRVKGLAEQAAAQFRSGGWVDVRLGNYTGRLPVTTLYFEPGQQGEAQRLATQFPGIERVLPRFEGLPGTGLTVVVTGDYRADRST